MSVCMPLPVALVVFATVKMIEVMKKWFQFLCWPKSVHMLSTNMMLRTLYAQNRQKKDTINFESQHYT